MKKLIEVALPLDVINKASAREKSIRHGHPSTLHLWWARRPTATARAVLFASLIDDPSEHAEKFPTVEAQQAERERFFKFIEKLVQWESSGDENEISLSVIQPQEVESIATYNDALSKLKTNLYYLYSKENRLWFGVNPTLRKLVDDKREQFSDDDIFYEIEQRLKIGAVERSEDGDLNCPMEVEKIECTKEDNITAASEKFFGGEMLLGALGDKVLCRFMDKFLWRDCDALKFGQLWEYFSTYYYLPRLVDVNVLIDTVQRGVKAETFGLAEDFRDGKYLELKFGDAACTHISAEDFLVKEEVAKKQLKIDDTPPPDTVKPVTVTPDTLPPEPTPPLPLPKFFSMDAKLDNVHFSREIKNYVDEIASYLMNLPNAEMSIRVIIDISVPEGIPQASKELVEKNCADFGIDAEHLHFES